jgi:hypothetical protein
VLARAVEIFLQGMLQKTSEYAASRRAKTLTVGHLKHCIENEKQWDFLKDLTAKIPDIAANEPEDVQKRGRKRKNSTSKSNTTTTDSSSKKKKIKKDEHVTIEKQDDSDSSSGESCHSSSSHTKSKSSEVSPTTTKKFFPAVSTATQSPLAAFAAGLMSKPQGPIPVPSSSSQNQPSPLLAYASSLSLPVSQTPPIAGTPSHNLSALTNLGQKAGGVAGGSHDNSEDEDYDA